nr:TetR/AcrR family transcriptional regulator [Dethiosulfatarculus sandiegensis]
MQKEDTRRIILNTAYQLFVEKGYAKTTMRSLAQKAGVGLGTISKHFPDKASLLITAFEGDLNRIINDSFNNLPSSGLKNQLLQLIESIYAFHSRKPAFSRALLREVLFLGGQYGEVLESQVYIFLGRIEGLIQQAINNNEIDSKINPQVGAHAFWSFYFLLLIAGLKQSSFDIKQQIKSMELFLTQHFYLHKKI